MMENTMKKVLVLTTSTGGGHNAAARALVEALGTRGVQARVQDCMAPVGKRFSRGVSRAYVSLVQRRPDMFGRVYRLGRCVSDWEARRGLTSPVYLFNVGCSGRLRALLQREQPDAVLCTHLYAGQMMTHLQRHGGFGGLSAFVMTDYTVIPFQEEVCCDRIYLSRPRLEKDYVSRGVDLARIRCFGIPVSPACEEMRGVESGSGCGILLLGGSMGAGDLPTAVETLLPLAHPARRLQVVCGSNAALRDALSARYAGDDRIEVLGQVDDMPRRIAGSRVVVGKSGGLVSTEVCAVGRPFVIWQPIEGCETANAAWLVKNDMAVWARDPQELYGHAVSLLWDEDARWDMVCQQRRYVNAHAALDIADDVLQALSERGKGGGDRG